MGRITNKYTSEHVAMAKKMAQNKMAKVYEAPSREENITNTIRRMQKEVPKGKSFRFKVPKYPVYV